MLQVEELDLNNKKNIVLIKNFLLKFDLDYQENLIDKTFVIYENNKIIASASCYSNLIKCLAVESSYQQFNLASIIITTLLTNLSQKYDEIFVISKPSVKKVFLSFGFYSIFQDKNFIFFTNQKEMFINYFKYLNKVNKNYNNDKKYAGLVMNCNPFTLGHLHLITTAAKLCHHVFIIPVREDISLFPYDIRLSLIKFGVQHLKNVSVLDGSNYIVSQAIFPSYFIKSDKLVIANQALLDANLFGQYYVNNLHLTDRFVGEEPLSMTTNIYNETLLKILPNYKIDIHIIPRLKVGNDVISASTVRELWFEKKYSKLKDYVPKSTYDFLISTKGEKIISLAQKNQISKKY